MKPKKSKATKKTGAKNTGVGTSTNTDTATPTFRASINMKVTNAQKDAYERRIAELERRIIELMVGEDREPVEVDGAYTWTSP